DAGPGHESVAVFSEGAAAHIKGGADDRRRQRRSYDQQLAYRGGRDVQDSGSAAASGVRWRPRLGACLTNESPSADLRCATEGLFGQFDHVIDSRLHEVIWQVGATALGGHDTRAALETLEGVVIEHLLSFGDARPPSSLVARFRCTRNTRSVASTADLLE